jgi:hypothetical protein
MVWLIKRKDNNNQYYADKPFEEYSKRKYCWMRNEEQYLHTLSCSHRSQIGLLANLLDVHYPSPSLMKAASRLNPQGPGGWDECPGWRGTGLCSTWARQGRAPQYTRFFLHDTLSTTAHLTEQSGPFTPDFFSCWAHHVFTKFRETQDSNQGPQLWSNKRAQLDMIKIRRKIYFKPLHYHFIVEH